MYSQNDDNHYPFALSSLEIFFNIFNTIYSINVFFMKANILEETLIYISAFRIKAKHRNQANEYVDKVSKSLITFGELDEIFLRNMNPFHCSSSLFLPWRNQIQLRNNIFWGSADNDSIGNPWIGCCFHCVGCNIFFIVQNRCTKEISIKTRIYSLCNI